MATTVAEMTQTELREMIETTIEQKLLELLGDPAAQHADNLYRADRTSCRGRLAAR